MDICEFKTNTCPHRHAAEGLYVSRSTWIA